MAMEENISWKIIYIATIFSLLVLGIAYYFITPREIPPLPPAEMEKIATLKNTRIEGRKDGKKSWEFFAAEGWTEKNQRTTRLFRVHSGQLFSQGKLAVKGLSAPEVRVQSRAEVIEALKASALIDLGKFSPARDGMAQWSKIRADQIVFKVADKKTELNGRVILTRKGGTISADKIDVDHTSHLAAISGHVRVARQDGVLTTDSAVYSGENELMKASGAVGLKLRSGRITTSIKCNSADLYNDIEKDIELAGSVEAVQGKKIAIGSNGIYSKAKAGLLLRGGSRAVIEKARSLLNEGTANKMSNPEIKKLLKEKTIIQADEIFFSTRTGGAQASGSVEVFQKGREARSQKAVYNDKSEMITLTGDVYMKRGPSAAGQADWIKCREVIVSVANETFDAYGAVETEFKL